MIRDSIENLKKYEYIFPVIPQVLEFFKQENISDGIHNICDGCFVNVQTFNTKQRTRFFMNYIRIMQIFR